MTSGPSIFQRIYSAAALVAVLNWIMIIGVLGYVLGKGYLNRETVGRVVKALREGPVDPDAVPEGAKSGAEAEETRSVVGSDAVLAAQMDSEILRLEGDRIRAELDQRLALNNSILLRVSGERDRFKKEQEDASKRQAAEQERWGEEGFKKQVEIYEELKPKVAMPLLLDLDPDEAARILYTVDTRTAKKMIESAKKPGDVSRMKAILTKLRDVAPKRSSALGAGEP